MKHERFFAVDMTVGVKLVTKWETDVLQNTLTDVISNAIKKALELDVYVIGIGAKEKKWSSLKQ